MKKKMFGIFVKSLCFFMGLLLLLIGVFLFIYCSTYGGFWVGIIEKFPIAMIATMAVASGIVYFILSGFIKK